MDGDGELIARLQAPPGPPADAYSALVANYSPSGDVLRRLLDAGIDQFFASANDLVVPSEGGWRIDRASTRVHSGRRASVASARRQHAGATRSRTSISSRTPETVDFLVNALLGPTAAAERASIRARACPDRRLLRAARRRHPASGEVAARPRPSAPPPERSERRRRS